MSKIETALGQNAGSLPTARRAGRRLKVCFQGALDCGDGSPAGVCVVFSHKMALSAAGASRR